MRIAVVTRTLARIGGVEAYVEQSVHGLREAGHDVCVFAEDRQTRAAGLSVPSWAPHEAMPAVDAAVRTFSLQIVDVARRRRSGSRRSPLVNRAVGVLRARAPRVRASPAPRPTASPASRPVSARSEPVAFCVTSRVDARPQPGDDGPGVWVATAPPRRGATPRTGVRLVGVHRRRGPERHGALRERIRVLPPPGPARRDTHDAVADPLSWLCTSGRLERLKGPAIAVAAVAAAAVRLARPLRLTVAGEGSALAYVQRAVATVTAACTAPGAARRSPRFGRLRRVARQWRACWSCRRCGPDHSGWSASRLGRTACRSPASASAASPSGWRME